MKKLAFTLKPVLAALVLGACSTGPSMPERAWKISPVQTVNHGGSAAAGYFALGRVKEGQGVTEQAIVAYRKALDADPTYTAAWNALGALLAQQGKYEEGLAALERAVSLSPTASHLHNNLGYAQLLSGRDEAAAASLRRAVDLDADNRRAWSNLATAYRRLGANERAEFAEARASNTWAAMQPAVAAAVPPQPRADADTAQPAPPTAPAPVVSELAATSAPAAVAAIAPSTRVTTPPVPAAELTPAPRTTLVKVAENVFELHNAPPPRTVAVAEAAAIIAAATKPATPPITQEPRRAAAGPVTPLTANPVASSNPTNTASARPARFEITNGHGGEGLARRLAALLGQQGMTRPRLTNQLPYTQTASYVEYRNGYRDAAEAFAAQLPFRPAVQPAAAGKLLVDVRLMLGHDLTTSDACAALGVCTHVARAAPVRAEPARVAAASVRRPSGD
ncbi:MAG TPA: LytR C-terminal domain-containing protein [Aromatoleum sp.]|uniref:LytR C-terminal domain-containing protein n=1 Tax=Aromatoleum sp. TaxID=2307007 RepID=UPI002B46E4A4|nr:LytR C-terminal domain-containing protein [Aromatoleum sp.]HJV26047.1 LytR C-terminal domain-containing protein [Aromatoleum sp.]